MACVAPELRGANHGAIGLGQCERTHVAEKGVCGGPGILRFAPGVISAGLASVTLPKPRMNLALARTLDVACGTGFLTRHLRGELTALDQSEAMLARAGLDPSATWTDG